LLRCSLRSRLAMTPVLGKRSAFAVDAFQVNDEGML
jgi:hypothetical protein